MSENKLPGMSIQKDSLSAVAGKILSSHHFFAELMSRNGIKSRSTLGSNAKMFNGSMMSLMNA